jgi:Restriction endonuclease
MPLKKVPIIVKPISAGADPLDVRAGQPVLPVERIKIFSPEQWEDFISEWATSLQGYGSVERVGGSGDMGCDVIATLDLSLVDGPWDNYQCKRYDHALGPDDIWIELGRLQRSRELTRVCSAKMDHRIPRR